MKKLSLILLLSCVFSGGLNAAAAPDGLDQNKDSDGQKVKKATALDHLKGGASRVGRLVVEGGPIVVGCALSRRVFNETEMRLKPGAMQVATVLSGAYLVRNISKSCLNRATPLTNVLGKFGSEHPALVNGSMLAALVAAGYYGASRLGYGDVATGTLLATAALTASRSAGTQVVATASNALQKSNK